MKLIFLLCISFISSGFCSQISDATNGNTTTEAATTVQVVQVQESEITHNIANPKSKAFRKEFDTKKNNGIRNPKFGFNLPNFPNIQGLFSSTPYPNYFGDSSLYDSSYSSASGSGSGMDATKLVDGGVGIATTLALVKGGILGGLTALKAAVLPPLFIGAVIVFLIAGAAFFVCNVVNCSNIIGSGSPFNNFFSRNGYEPYYGTANEYYNFENQVLPVYQALEDSYKKYGGGESKSVQ